MRKSILILLLILCLALLMSSCSKSVQLNDDNSEEKTGSELSGNTTERKIVITAEYSIETRNFKDAVSSLNSQVTELGGYVEISSIQNDDENSSNANFVFRIPADKLSGFLSFVEGSGNVLSGSQTGKDVTIEYYDTQSELNALKVKEERILALLEKAENLTEILSLEEELNKTRTSIEKLNTRINELNNLVNYATVEIYLFEVNDFTEKKPGFGRTILNAIKTSGSTAFTFFKYFIVVIIYILPYVIVFGIIIFLCLYLKKNRRNK